MDPDAAAGGREMSTKTRTRRTPEERRAQVTALRDRLAEWEGEAGEELIAEALARFDGYSERNAKLIAMQCPDATDVRGFRAWIDAGRCVRKGEHSIVILAPCPARPGKDAPEPEVVAPVGDPESGDVEGSSQRMRFRLAYVFDVSQTDVLTTAGSVAS